MAFATPAITVGAHVKMNEGIFHIDEGAFGTMEGSGMSDHCATDFTIVGTKKIPDLLFQRPLVASAGMRFTRGAHIGMMGFGHGLDRVQRLIAHQAEAWERPLRGGVAALAIGMGSYWLVGA